MCKRFNYCDEELNKKQKKFKMIRASSTSLFNAWLEIAKEQKEILQTHWRNNREFTNLIFHSEDFFLKKVPDKIGLSCYSKNYYSVDAIFYTKDDLVPDLPENNYWFRNIRIAFEHENNFNSGLHQEVSHLLILNAELRVLVTYPINDQGEEEVLAWLHSIIAGTPLAKQLSEDESFLLIFGYENNFEWKGLVYKTDDWKVLINPQ